MPGSAAPELAGGNPRSRWRAVRLHVSEPRPLSLAVVLGLVLHRHRLAAGAAGALTARARVPAGGADRGRLHRPHHLLGAAADRKPALYLQRDLRSEEHTSELQSRRDLVCRLLLEKKKK